MLFPQQQQQQNAGKIYKWLVKLLHSPAKKQWQSIEWLVDFEHSLAGGQKS